MLVSVPLQRTYNQWHPHQTQLAKPGRPWQPKPTHSHTHVWNKPHKNILLFRSSPKETNNWNDTLWPYILQSKCSSVQPRQLLDVRLRLFKANGYRVPVPPKPLPTVTLTPYHTIIRIMYQYNWSYNCNIMYPWVKGSLSAQYCQNPVSLKGPLELLEQNLKASREPIQSHRVA